MFSKILNIPFVIGILVALYLTMVVDENYSLYILLFIIPTVIIFIFAPQIDWWWYQIVPPKLDANVAQIIQQNFPFYNHLSTPLKEKFQIRTALFMIANEYMPQGMEGVPEDIKGMIAAEAVKLTFGYNNFMFDDFEKIVVYPTPFPSPQFPKSFHASEIFAEDGVVLFSAQQVAHAFFQPRDYFSLPLYEYAKVFVHTFPDEPYPTIDHNIWNKLENISGFSFEAIQKWINLDKEAIDPLAATIYHFFNYPGKFKSILPDIFDSLVSVFRQDPTNTNNPTILPINA